MAKQKIKSFDDACKALKLKPVLPEVSMLPEKHRKSIIAYYMLTTIAEALNEGWVPNWNDEDEDKWYNYFWVEASDDKPSGFGFSYSYASCDGTLTAVGSRLCFKSSDLAVYAREQFKQLYLEYLLLL